MEKQDDEAITAEILAALRDDLRRLQNVMELLLTAVSPKDAAFYAKAQELEAQIGKTAT